MSNFTNLSSGYVLQNLDVTLDSLDKVLYYDESGNIKGYPANKAIKKNVRNANKKAYVTNNSNIMSAGYNPNIFLTEKAGELAVPKVVIGNEEEQLCAIMSYDENRGGISIIVSRNKLAPGLYDENDNLLISWEDLTSLEYKSIEYKDYDAIGDVVTYTKPILNVDENGVLTSAFSDDWYENYSSSYLNGKLVIGNNVTNIGDNAFYNCGGLTSINIPNSITNIGSNAFNSCSGLTSVYFNHTVAPNFGINCFYKTLGSKCTFYFKNSTVYDVFTTSYYNSNYGTKSTNYDW